MQLLAKQKGRWSAALNWGVGLPDGLLFLMGRYNARVQLKSLQLDRRERQGSGIIRRRRLIHWYPMCRSQIRREATTAFVVDIASAVGLNSRIPSCNLDVRGAGFLHSVGAEKLVRMLPRTLACPPFNLPTP